EYLDVMVDPAEMICDLHQAELREVPHVRRQLAGDARMARKALDMLVEVLVDTIDENGHGRANRAQARHQVAICVCATALELAWREIKEANEVVDDALELRGGGEASQSGANFELAQCADVLESRKR